MGFGSAGTLFECDFTTDLDQGEDFDLHAFGSDNSLHGEIVAPSRFLELIPMASGQISPSMVLQAMPDGAF